ncbi:MAG: glycosyltransferase [Eubacterium sp.]|nr:glycosyltransferase [Eubacterium sp.]
MECVKGRVTVIVLSYRKMKGIYESLKSILSQDYSDIEVIISDDGSAEFPPHEAKIIKYIETHKKDNLSNYIINHLPVNQGTVKNVNSAIRLSSGEYIKLLAAEDILAYPEALSDYVSHASTHPELLFFGKVCGITKDGKKVHELLSCESDYDLLKTYTAKDIHNRLMSRNFLPAPAGFIKKKAFEKYGLFDEDIRLIEDYSYWLKLSGAGEEFGFIDKVMIYYKATGVSSQGNYSRMFMDDLVKIYDKYIFPCDRRFGPLQGVYNFLKREGLNFYIAKAGWKDYSLSKRLYVYHRYFPFFAYTKLQNISVDMKNQKLH